MAFTNQTTHYGLPLPIGSDKSTWLDTNTAFAAIDAAIYQASTDAAAAAGDISTIQGDITALQSGKQNVLTFDAAPTFGSTNPVTSGGVYDALALKLDSSVYTSAMGNTSITGIGDGTVTGAISTLNTKVTGDSVTVPVIATTTYGAILTALKAAYDITKLTPRSVLAFPDGQILQIKSTATGIFITCRASGSGAVVDNLGIEGGWWSRSVGAGAETDLTSTQIGTAGDVTLYY